MRQLFYLLNYHTSFLKIALVKYSGGGDWYANLLSLPNLIKYCNANINTRIKQNQQRLNPVPIYFHYIHMTGHGNVVLMTLTNNKKLFTRWRFSSY
jgi:hypothetical protein